MNLTLSGGDATDLTVTGLGIDVYITNSAAHGTYIFANYTGNFNSSNLILADGSLFATNMGRTAGALSGTANNDQLIAGRGGDTLTGGGGDDMLTGGDGADSIDGGDGVDTINGGEGNDTITAGDGGADGGTADSQINGGTGSDSITGGAFEDLLIGGAGNDTLAGGLDVDTLTGGLGDDVFSYAVAEVATTDTDVDVITDAFTGADAFAFSDLTNTSLRGDGSRVSVLDASIAQAMGANVGFLVAANATGNFTEATIYSALVGIADDLANGDSFYLLISNGTEARLARITEANNAGTLSATDDTLEFVARLEGVSHTTLAGLSASNFIDFVA